jgi:hypothetical protein
VEVSALKKWNSSYREVQVVERIRRLTCFVLFTIMAPHCDRHLFVGCQKNLGLPAKNRFGDHQNISAVRVQHTCYNSRELYTLGPQKFV